LGVLGVLGGYLRAAWGRGGGKRPGYHLFFMPREEAWRVWAGWRKRTRREPDEQGQLGMPLLFFGFRCCLFAIVASTDLRLLHSSNS